MFLPAYTGTIKIDSKISFEGNCFEKIEMEMNQISKLTVVMTNALNTIILIVDFLKMLDKPS